MKKYSEQMKGLVNIHIGPIEELPYQKEEHALFTTHFPEGIIIDADNHSSSIIFDQATKLLQDLDTIVVLLCIHQNETPAAIASLLKQIGQLKERTTYFVLWGKSPFFEKLGKKIAARHYYQIDELTQFREILSQLSA